MKRDQFVQLLRSPSTINLNLIGELEEITQRFPYFQNAHVLLAKQYHGHENIRYESYLRKASAYCPDRAVLYHLIQSEPSEIIHMDSAQAVPDLAKIEAEPESTFVEPIVPPAAEFVSDNSIATDPLEIIENRLKEIQQANESENTVKEIQPPKEEIIPVTNVLSSEPVDETSETNSLIEPDDETVETLSLNDPVERPVEIPELTVSEKVPDVQTDEKFIGEKINIEEKPSTSEIKIESYSELLSSETDNQITSQDETGSELISDENILDEVKNTSFVETPDHLTDRETEIQDQLGKVSEKDIEEDSDALIIASEKPKGKITFESHSFIKWLQIKNVPVVPTEPPGDYLQSITQAESVPEKKPGRKPGDELLEKFIHTEPRIVPQKSEFYSPGNMARKSVTEHEDLISETLARIYAQQGNIPKAIDAYRRLGLKMPEKSSYFAALIKELEENEDNSDYK